MKFIHGTFSVRVVACQVDALWYMVYKNVHKILQFYPYKIMHNQEFQHNDLASRKSSALKFFPQIEEYENYEIHCLTIAKEQRIYSKQPSRQMINSSKIKCRGRGKAGFVICIKGNAHKLFISSEFYAVRCLAKIAPQVVELISVKLSVAIIKCKMLARHHLSAPTIVDEQLDIWQQVRGSPLWPQQWERQKVPSRDQKKPLKMEMLRKNMPVVVEGSSRLKRIHMYPQWLKGTEMPLLAR